MQVSNNKCEFVKLKEAIVYTCSFVHNPIPRTRNQSLDFFNNENCLRLSNLGLKDGITGQKYMFWDRSKNIRSLRVGVC